MKLTRCLINYLLMILIGLNSGILIIVSPYANIVSAILYHYLIVRYAIIYPFEKINVIKKDNLLRLIIDITIINTTIFVLFKYDIYYSIILILVTIVFLIFSKGKKERNNDIIENNIKEYYDKNKNI